jgi:CHAD domain-containing protein
MQTLLIQYCDTCFNSLAANIKTVSDDNSIDSVHNLRLSIKRVRALLILIDQAENLNESELIKQIDSLFLYSGQLRDIHIQTILLESYRAKVGTEVDFFISYIKKGKNKIIKRLENSVRQVDFFDIVLFNQRLDCFIESLDSSSHEKNCRLKVVRLYEQILQQVNENSSEKALHRIRIMLKELIYSLSIFKKGKLTIDFNVEDIKNLNNLQQKLGNWHDLTILLNKITIENSKLGGILLQQVKSDIKSLQTEIISSLKNLK